MLAFVCINDVFLGKTFLLLKKATTDHTSVQSASLFVLFFTQWKKIILFSQHTVCTIVPGTSFIINYCS
jgi:hypothetical protein